MIRSGKMVWVKSLLQQAKEVIREGCLMLFTKAARLHGIAGNDIKLKALFCTLSIIATSVSEVFCQTRTCIAYSRTSLIIVNYT